MVSEAPRQNSGSVSVLYREVEHFTLEALRLHGLNVIKFQLELGGQRSYVVRCYLVPGNTSTTDAVVATIR